jgi:hypothetical protein
MRLLVPGLERPEIGFPITVGLNRTLVSKFIVSKTPFSKESFIPLQLLMSSHTGDTDLPRVVSQHSLNFAPQISMHAIHPDALAGNQLPHFPHDRRTI